MINHEGPRWWREDIRAAGHDAAHDRECRLDPATYKTLKVGEELDSDRVTITRKYEIRIQIEKRGR